MSDEPVSPEDLRAQIARLEAENGALRAQLADDQPGPGAPVAAPVVARRGRGWTVLAAVLIVLGCLLAPLAVVSGWAKATLTDTDRFVATYAPLARNPEVQTFVVDQTVKVINDNVDVNQLTSDVIDGIKQLGTRPRATAALEALKGPAAQGIQSLIRSGVTAFVTSDAFATTWQGALRLSHTQLLATLGNDPQALVAAQSNGTLGVQLGPIVEDAKTALLSRGITIAARIPAVDRTIPIAQSDAIPTIQTSYRAIIGVGTWLPWVSLLLLTAGVLVARRRSLALVWAATGLGLSMIVLLLAFGTGRLVLLTAIPASLVPAGVTTLLYDTATAAMKDTATAALVLAVVVAAVAWFAGPFGTPRRLRGLYLDGVDYLRRNAEEHGLTTGQVGTWLYAQRRLLYLIIALAASAAILLLRPLTVQVIVTTLVVAVLGVIIISVLERPGPTPTAAAEEPAIV